MKNNCFVDPFLKILPTLDLHGETSDSAVWLVKDFINMHQKLGNNKVAIIHGRHSDIIKKAIHKYLRTEKKATKFYIYAGNGGVTIVEIAPLVKLL